MDNSTSVSTHNNLSTGFDDDYYENPLSNDSFISVINFWDIRFQNISSQPVDLEDEEDLPVLLSVRLAIIVGVIVIITILSWGSYAVYRKRIRDSKRDKHQKTLLL